MLKGLTLSEQFFADVVLPLVRRELPECLPHIAAGLPGGSQAHGNDDEVSRDHGWGGGVEFWVVHDYDRWREPLLGVLRQLPREYEGYPAWWNIVALEEFVRRTVGCAEPPEAAIDWLRIPEEHLFEIMHRPIFHDPTGEATRRMAAFRCYPEDVWKKRLAACLAWLYIHGIKQHRRAE